MATAVDTWSKQKWHTTTDDEKNDPNNDKTKYPFPQPQHRLEDNSIETPAEDFLSKGPACRVEKAFFPDGEVKNGPHAWDLIAPEDIPDTVDWRNMNGKNYLSWNKN